MTGRAWVLTGVVALVAVAGAGGVVALTGGARESPDEEGVSVSTAVVRRGDLSASVSAAGTLTHRARPDGSPYPVVNRADGTYTMLPEVGARVACGNVMYRVDEKPVLLLCGGTPVYRDLGIGDRGSDARQLNMNLHRLGYDRATDVDVDPDDDAFTWRTQTALLKLQRDRGLDETGRLAMGDAVVLPSAVRASRIEGQIGGPARAGTPVAQATSGTLVVRVDLDVSRQGDVKKGDRARITLPSNRSVAGRVDRLGRVARADGDENTSAGATIPVFILLDVPGAARGFDEAPVRVEITTTGVKDVLSVPVVAIVGRPGGGFAVEVVRDGGRRELVAVKLGLFDTTGGRVQVTGGLRDGDRVVVPSS